MRTISRKTILAAFFVLFTVGTLSARQSVTQSTAQTPPEAIGGNRVSILFRFDSDVVDAEFMENGRNLTSLGEMLSDNELISRLKSVEIVAAASPEGDPAHNRQLALNRAESLKRYILALCPAIAPEMIVARADDGYWDGLIEAVGSDPDVPEGAALLETLRNPNLSDAEKNHRMTTMSGGRTLAYLRGSLILRRLRSGSTDIRLIVQPEPAPQPRREEPQPEPVREEPVAVPQTQPQPEPTISQPVATSKPFRLDVRTNLLYDALLVPTLGVEWHASESVGLKLDGGYSFWGSEHGWVQKTWHLNLEVRWYMGDAKRFYVGASANFGEYNIYKGVLGGLVSKDTGYQGDLWNAGVTVGYRLPLSRSLSLDFNLGLGYTNLEYDSFEVINRTRVYKAKGLTKNFWGPTQAGVNLVWTIGGHKQ